MVNRLNYDKRLISIFSHIIPQKNLITYLQFITAYKRDSSEIICEQFFLL